MAKTVSLRRRTEDHVRDLVGHAWHQPPRSLDAYQKRIGRLRDQLARDFKSQSGYYLASLFLYRQITERLTDLPFQVEPPLPPLRVKRAPQYRTERWAARAREIWVWEDQLKARLADLEGRRLLNDEYLGLMLYSAMTRGLLCNPDFVTVLANHAHAIDPLLAHAPCDQLAVSLRLEVDSGPANVEEESATLNIKQWVPDPITLGLLLRYREQVSRPPPPDLTKPHTFALIERAIWGEDQNPTLLRSLQALTQASHWWTEHQPGAAFSEALIEVAVGRTDALSLDPRALQQLVRPRLTSINGLALDELPAPATRPQILTERPKKTPDFRRLTAVIRLKPEAGQKKVTKDSMRKALDAVPPDLKANQAAKLLIDWYQHLLTRRHNRCQPSTIRRYHNEVASAFMALADGLDLRNLDGDELQSLYQEIVDTRRSDYAKAFSRARLQQLHDFAVTHPGYRLPPLPEPMVEKETRPHLVRARIISLEAYLALRRWLGHQQTQSDLAEQLDVLVILAFRTGLRLGELINLRLIDLENSPERWLFVTNTRFGSLKSPAARRKVPLNVLLTDDERQGFQAYFDRRRRADRDVERPFFLQPGTAQPLPAPQISAMLSRALRALHKDPNWTFHHFRHSAFSRLHLVIEREYRLASALAGWSEKQCAQIRRSIVGPETSERNGYWALARLAGHATPLETLQSYCHLSDLLIRTKLDRIEADAVDQKHLLTRAFPDFEVSKPSEAPLTFADLTEANRNWMPAFRDDADHTDQPLSESGQPIALTAAHEATAYRPEKCIEVLSAINEVIRPKDAAAMAGVDPDIAERWYQTAKALAQIKTRRGELRLFTKQRQKSAKGELLLPTPPKSDADHREALAMIDHLLHIDRADAEWWCQYQIMHSSAAHPWTLFDDPEALGRFLEICDPVWPVGRWAFKLKVPAQTDLTTLTRSWKSQGAPDRLDMRLDGSVPGNKRSYKANSTGKLSVYEGNTESRRHALDGSRFAAHLACIMLGAKIFRTLGNA